MHTRSLLIKYIASILLLQGANENPTLTQGPSSTAPSLGLRALSSMPSTYTQFLKYSKLHLRQQPHLHRSPIRSLFLLHPPQVAIKTYRKLRLYNHARHQSIVLSPPRRLCRCPVQLHLKRQCHSESPHRASRPEYVPFGPHTDRVDGTYSEQSGQWCLSQRNTCPLLCGGPKFTAPDGNRCVAEDVSSTAALLDARSHLDANCCAVPKLISGPLLIYLRSELTDLELHLLEWYWPDQHRVLPRDRP